MLIYQKPYHARARNLAPKSILVWATDRQNRRPPSRRTHNPTPFLSKNAVARLTLLHPLNVNLTSFIIEEFFFYKREESLKKAFILIFVMEYSNIGFISYPFLPQTYTTQLPVYKAIYR